MPRLLAPIPSQTENEKDAFGEELYDVYRVGRSSE
jgi:hypothetical protein